MLWLFLALTSTATGIFGGLWVKALVREGMLFRLCERILTQAELILNSRDHGKATYRAHLILEDFEETIDKVYRP